ncbi:MAG: DUF11 domain-containing protein [Anaerolineales bacterium]|nr:DUF11 domain-containing protein [Anaerolineales bacterium]
MANNTTLATDGDPTTAGQQPTITEIAHTDLSVTKTVADNNPAETGAVVYTVVVTNRESNAATTVTVADALPAGLTLATSSATQGAYVNPTWSVGTLAGGATATLTINATANLGQGGTTITNTASASAAYYDLQPADNTASVGLLAKTTSLHGTVTDVETGAPLVGVTIETTDSLGNHCTATTGAGGIYLVTSGQNGCLLAPGVATVAATGGAPTGYLLGSINPTIIPGIVNTGNLTLAPASLSGVVTDLGSGVPLVGATVI